MKNLLLLLLPLLQVGQLSHAYPAIADDRPFIITDTSACDAALVFTFTDDMLTMQAVYLNTDTIDHQLRYTLTTQKESKSGTSTSRQSGRKYVASLAKIVLSSSTINYDSNGHYTFTLQVGGPDGEVWCTITQQWPEK